MVDGAQAIGDLDLPDHRMGRIQAIRKDRPRSLEYVKALQSGIEDDIRHHHVFLRSPSISPEGLLPLPGSIEDNDRLIGAVHYEDPIFDDQVTGQARCVQVCGVAPFQLYDFNLLEEIMQGGFADRQQIHGFHVALRLPALHAASQQDHGQRQECGKENGGFFHKRVN